MTNQDQARAAIQSLVEKFRNTPARERARYNEQQTREYFVLPLFRALGWDTENAAEVTAEEQISRGFVDFGFYLDGVPRFYLETKKITADLGKSEWANQAINYAYLKGVTWAVLSDFEGLKVFNAEWEETNPQKAIFLDLSWENYADTDFDNLWLLSKEAIRDGEIDRLAERFGKKARKRPVTEQLFAQLTQWRRELFKEIRGWDKTLWSNDPRAVDNAVQRLLDRLIFIRTVEDRGIEAPRLHALIRQYKASRGKDKNLFHDLQALFREMDGIYNARLFAESTVDHVEVHNPDLLTSIINGLYDSPGGFISYNFNAIDADVLGSIYEQYLGFKALDPTGQEAIDLAKRQKRKAQGIYYTPQFVVRYIVQNTLGRLLEEGADPHAIRVLDPACGSGSFLIEAFDVLDRWLAQHGTPSDRQSPRTRRLRILQENLYGVDLDEQAVEVARLNLLLRAAGERGKLPMLDHIKRGNSLIDDPAVAGDAAFKWEEEFPEVFAGDTRPLWFVTFVTHNSRVSERMVEYGVKSGEPLIFTPEDQVLIAEKIAEACAVSHIPVVAWNVLPDHVHMVIGAEDEQTLNEYVRKIKGGSSHAFQRAKGWEKGEQHVWAQKFHHQIITHERMLADVVEYVVNNHLKHADQWGAALLAPRESGDRPEALHANPYDHVNKGLKPLVRSIDRIIGSICVTPEEAAHIPGGFDVVIGNPPYVRMETFKEVKSYLRDRYRTHAERMDIYGYFIELEHELLRSGGRFGMIVSNKFLRAHYGMELRRYITENAQLETMVDLAGLPVFPDATVRTVIITSRRTPNGNQAPMRYTAPMSVNDYADVAARLRSLQDVVEKTAYEVQPQYLLGETWSFARAEENALLMKLQDIGIALVDYLSPLPICMGVKSGLTEAFVIGSTIRRAILASNPEAEEIIKPLLNGRNVRRYLIEPDDQYLIYTYHGIDISQYPSIEAHLKPYKARLEGRATIQAWYELQQPQQNYAEFMDSPKIIFPDIGITTRFALDTEGYYGTNTTYFFPTTDLYLLGLLNSQVAQFYFTQKCAALEGADGAYLRFFGQYLEGMPIAKADVARHDRMVALVQQMLDLKQQHATAEAAFDDSRHDLAQKIERLDAEIDALVYDLYGLTDEEIALVEGRPA